MSTVQQLLRNAKTETEAVQMGAEVVTVIETVGHAYLRRYNFVEALRIYHIGIDILERAAAQRKDEACNVLKKMADKLRFHEDTATRSY